MHIFHLHLWLSKSYVWIIILALGFTPVKNLAVPCVECDPESFAISQSKGPGFAALVAGGTLALSGAVVLMAAAARNQRSDSSSSSSSIQQNNNDNALNQNMIATNTANTGANTGTGVATNGLTNVNQLNGLVNTNAITATTPTQGGNPTVGNIPTIREKIKRENCENKQETLTFHYQLAVLTEHSSDMTLVPFVVCPDGTKIEASPIILRETNSSVSFSPINIDHAINGIYLAGIYLQDSSYPCALEMTLLSSNGESQTAHISSLNDQEIVHPFNHDAEL